MKNNPNMKNRISIIALMFSGFLFGEAGELTLTLDDCIARAREMSVEAAVARNELRTAYWQYRTYRAERLPEVTFNASLPGYHRNYSSYMNENGGYSFVRTNYLEMQGSLAITQQITLTGGSISLNSSLDWLRQLERPAYNRFMTIPVALTLSQPIFGVNTPKWNSRIEPVRYREAKAAYVTATEQVAMTAVQRYFSLLLAIENENIARRNLDNAMMLHKVAREKRKLGEISKNDLLQMELNELQARSELTEGISNRKAAVFDMLTFLDLDADSTELKVEVPASVPDIEPTFSDVLDKALERNSLASNLRRRQLEADYTVAQAKAGLRSIMLNASIGYTGTDHNLSPAYTRLNSNQVVEIGVTIPLLDWGKRRGRVKVAESNRDVIQARLRQEHQAFEQSLFVLTERFLNQRRQLDIALRSDTIATRRYETNVETYLIGRISTLDLNDSRTSKDTARRTYINELFSYWYYYYQIRSLTLWDFERNQPLEFPEPNDN